MSFSKKIVDNALVACGRSCCICHKLCGVRIETHHIKPISKGGDDSLENCMPVCFDCHAEIGHYNDEHPRGRKFSVDELRKHRDAWFRQVKELNTPIHCEQPDPSKVIQIVSGKSNVVAGRDVNVQTEKIVKKNLVWTDPGGRHISNATARKIKEIVDEFIDIANTAGKNPSSAAKRIWGRLYKEFNVTSYKEIANEDSEKAINWLHSQLAQSRPSIRRKSPEKWKLSFYKPIYARANELGFSKEDVYRLAFDRIPLKKPIDSLKQLTQRDLEKLHRLMIYEMRKASKNS